MLERGSTSHGFESALLQLRRGWGDVRGVCFGGGVPYGECDAGHWLNRHPAPTPAYLSCIWTYVWGSTRSVDKGVVELGISFDL